MLHGDGRTSTHDCPSLDEAKNYANDVASEADWDGHGANLAYVVDAQFRAVFKGRFYAQSQ